MMYKIITAQGILEPYKYSKENEFEQDGDSAENVDTVVEPDISLVCDRSKLDKRGCKGASDMIVEVLSRSRFGMIGL